MSAITQAMLDAERERIQTAYEQVTYEGRVYTAGALEGFNRAIALLREHGKLVGHTVPANTVSGAAPGPRFVRVEIPAE